MITPKFNETVLDILLSSGGLELDLVKLAIKKPQQLLNHGELSYISAMTKLEAEEESLASLQQRKPNSVLTTKTAKRVEILQLVCIYLREISVQQAKNLPDLRDHLIIFAISADSTSLFDQLQQEGANPSHTLGKLGNGELPISLLTSENKNLKAWFTARAEKADKSMATHPNSFLNKSKRIQELERQLAELDLQHAQGKIKLRTEQLAIEQDYINQVVAVLR